MVTAPTELLSGEKPSGTSVDLLIEAMSDRFFVAPHGARSANILTAARRSQIGPATSPALRPEHDQ
jgi:hypothetical protein